MAGTPKKTTEKTTRRSGRFRRRPAPPTQEAIALRAYELSQIRGDGDHVGHWLEAERELAGA